MPPLKHRREPLVRHQRPVVVEHRVDTLASAALALYWLRGVLTWPAPFVLGLALAAIGARTTA